MFKAFLSFIAISLLLGCALVRAASPAVFDQFNEADKLFTEGDNLQRDKQALAVIEAALATDGTNYQWLWRAARCHYHIGDNVGKAEKLAYFQKGIEAGRRAIAREPNAVEGHFWLAANYGGYSQEKGMFSALATVKKIRAEMETVLRLNDRYQNGGAYHALGEMDRLLPRIIGGNLGRAIARLEQGLRVAPNNLELKLSLAQAYQEAGRRDEARRHAQEIAAHPTQKQGDRRLQEKARQILSKS